MAILGTRYLSYAGAYSTIPFAAGNQVAVVDASLVAPAAGYAIKIGGWMRRFSGHAAANVWLAAYTLDTTGAPAVEIAHTDRIPLSSTGSDVSGFLTWVNPLFGDEQTAARLLVSQPFALVLKAESGNVEVAQTVAAMTQYQRTYAVDNAPPTNPFAATSTSGGQGLALYLDFVENSPPSVSLISPADAAVVNTNNPVLVASFDDPNDSAPTLDKVAAYALEVRRQSDNVLIWGGATAVFIATSAMRIAGQITHTYSGPALTAAIPYVWRAEVYDDAGASSGWSTERTFTLNAAGRVDVSGASTPAAKVDTASTLIDWGGNWSHPSAHAANALQVQVYRNGSPFRLGAEVVQAVAGTATLPGTAFTVQDTVAGIGLLPPGSYSYAIRGRSNVDAQWGAYSDQRLFAVNALPFKPTNLQPPSGSLTTSLPLLEYNVDDPDDDDVFGVDDDAELEIIRPSGVTISAFSTNWDAVRKVGWYQVTASDFNAFGIFKWRVRGRDTSAGVDGYGPWSDYAQVTYASGPTIAITNPTASEVETTSVPTITWTVSGGTQQSARVLMYLADNPLPFRAQSIAGSQATFQIPVGWLVNGGAYDVVVEAWIAGGIKGASLRRQFSVAYSTPLVLSNVQATAVMERHDYYGSPSSVLISWGLTSYPPGEFRGYVLRRRKAGERAQDATVLRTLLSSAQTSWRDYWAPSREVLIYGVSQLRQVGAQILESQIVEVSSELILQVPILCSAYDALTYRFPLMYIEQNYEWDTDRPEAAFVTWGSRNKKTHVTTPAEDNSRKVSVTVTIRSDSRGTLYDHLGDFEGLRKSGHPLYFRPERQEEAMYCRINRGRSRRAGVGERTIQIELEEIDFTPGEQGGS